MEGGFEKGGRGQEKPLLMGLQAVRDILPSAFRRQIAKNFATLVGCTQFLIIMPPLPACLLLQLPRPCGEQEVERKRGKNTSLPTFLGKLN